ncbi:MAG: hypothetical protein SNJ64_00915 [Endomicrobiia bacterium]
MNKHLPEEIINFFSTKEIWQYINILVRIFVKYNVEYYFVGGAVRDGIICLLNPKKKYHIQDIDIVICNKELNYLIKKIKCLEQFKNAEIKTYTQFLTASISIDKYRIDLSCPRKEKYNFSGALPSVSKGTIEEDLFRRDFTINSIAIMWDKKSCSYKFYDPFCGMKDIKYNLIRVLHKKSFFDDPTRIIRAIRFSTSLDYELEKNTKKYLTNAVDKNVLLNISRDRLVNEFLCLLKKCDDIFLAIKMLKKYNIAKSYDFIEDFLKLLEKDGKKLNLKKVDISKEDRYFIRLLYLFDKVLSKSNFYNKKIFIKQKLDILKLKKEEKLKINNAIDFLYYGKKSDYSWVSKYVEVFNKKIFVPIISAKDLLDLGVNPGPVIGEILLKIKQLQQKGKLHTKFDAIKFVKQLLRLK